MQRAEAGSRPGGRVPFLCFATKEGKRNTPQQGAPPARPSGGDGAVLNNVGYTGGRVPAGDPAYSRNWEGVGGAGYRLVADLGDPNGSAWTVTLEGQSANAGSANRSDQLDDFLAGRYHEIPLDRGRAEAAAVHRLIAEPRGRHG